MARPKKELLAVSAAGKELGVSLSTIWRMVRRGDLPTVRVGRRRFVEARILQARVRTAEAGRLRPFDQSNPIWSLVGAYRSPGKRGSSDKHALLDE